jgi:hypothetical protein
MREFRTRNNTQCGFAYEDKLGLPTGQLEIAQTELRLANFILYHFYMLFDIVFCH